MGSHSLISTARAESHWIIAVPNQSNLELQCGSVSNREKIKIVPRHNQSCTVFVECHITLISVTLYLPQFADIRVAEHGDTPLQS
jgi:hypothetical protein